MPSGLPTRFLGFLLLLLLAIPAINCASDPNVTLFPAYDQQARRILAAHQQMGILFREINTGDEREDADASIAKIKERVVPGLGKLADDANSLNLEQAPALKELNALLVAALVKKQAGYAEMVKAYEKQDPQAFKEAKQKVLQATQDIVNFEQQLAKFRASLG